MKKDRKLKPNSGISNAISTGGGGIIFETRIDAVFLLFLLLGKPAPILRRPIKSVCFQTKRNGFDTDDLLVKAEYDDAKLLCQMKRSLTVSENNETFQKVIRGAWHDYTSGNFNPKKDKIGLFTAYIAKGSAEALDGLHELATKSPSAEVFYANLQQPLLYSNETREKFQAIKSVILSTKPSDPPSDEEIWGFFKIFHLAIFDLNLEASINKDLINALILCNATCPVQFVWDRLVNFAQECNQVSSDITLQNFDSDLKAFFNIAEQGVMAISERELGVGNFPCELDDFTAKLALLGAWDDSNHQDRKIIEELFGLKFIEFQKKTQSLLANGFTYMSKIEHIWKISNREKLFKLSEKYYTDDDITKFFSCVQTVVFAYGGKDRSDAGVSLILHVNKAWMLSKTICNEILAGACIMCSNPPKFCTEETLETNKIQLIRTVFDAFGKESLLRLGEALPYLAEIGSDSYLKELEALLSKDKNGLKTKPKSEYDYLFGDEICYLLWSIEFLVWDPKTFIIAIRCFAELEIICHDSENLSRSPLDAIVSVLLPWHPQTLASVDLQKKAIFSLCEEYPEIARKVIKKLLPQETEIVMPINRPRFSRLPIPKTISVGGVQFWEMSTFLFEQSMLLSGNDPAYLSELVKYLFFFGMRQDVLLIKLRDLGKTWSDKEKFHPWIALSELKYRLLENNCGENMPLFRAVAETINLLEPKDIFFKHQRLFVSIWNEYQIMEDSRQSYENERAKKQELVKEIHANYGIRGVMDFGRAVAKAEEICTLLGSGASMETMRELLPYYKDVARDRMLVLIALQSFLNKHGYAVLLQIGLQELNSDLVLDILTSFNYQDTLKSVMETLIPERKVDFWKKVKLPCGYMDGCDIDLNDLIASLRMAKRYTGIVNILGNSPELPPINIELLYLSLEQAATAADADVLDPHAALRLIGALQENADVDFERLSVIEWYYLPFFQSNSKTKPRALKFRLANSPAFFCQLIEMTYKKRHEVMVDGEKMDEGLSRRLFDLLFTFDVVPGMDNEGNFHEENFCSWVQETIKWSLENDREDVTKNTIGNGLSYLPFDKEHPLPRSVLKFLDSKENKSVRAGYSMGIYNQRGVHVVDREGKEETMLADRYRDLADSVRAMGYSRFAETLDQIAEYYLEEKKWNARDNLDDK